MKATLIHFIGAAALAVSMASQGAIAQSTPPLNQPPTARMWSDLAKLPDWSGIWVPGGAIDPSEEGKRMGASPPPWNPTAAAQIADMVAESKDGHPKLIFYGCLPEAMPSWMLVSHNAMEFVFSPGRVTLLGESDGNRLRRIYTDGRKHPDDPDLTFHGHSIGHWDGDTLVVDTVGVRPQTYIAVSESAGVPNNGDMHIVERIHLESPDLLRDDLEITAPKVFTKPWKISNFFHRTRKYDIVEGVCQEGSFTEGADKYGNSIFVPVPLDSEGAQARSKK